MNPFVKREPDAWDTWPAKLCLAIFALFTAPDIWASLEAR